jgi:hypothetical protein
MFMFDMVCRNFHNASDPKRYSDSPAYSLYDEVRFPAQIEKLCLFWGVDYAHRKQGRDQFHIG